LGSFNISGNGINVGEVGSGLSKKLINEYFEKKPKKVKVVYQEKSPENMLRFLRVRSFVY